MMSLTHDQTKNHSSQNLRIEQCQLPPGEAKCHYSDEHTIFISLASRPVRLLQIHEGQSYTGLYCKGHISLIPAQMSIFARWEQDEEYLQIRLGSKFIQSVARETLTMNPDQIELRPEFRIRDPQIEAVAMLLLAEYQSENIGSRLYLDSLTNVLAVHLLRQYAVLSSRLAIYEGGLPEYQVRQVLEYINEHLSQEIKLSDLAQLLGMSQYHFSHLFKQAIGVAPYQYLIQQRIERAKQLLKQTDQSILEIALECGFNSHSHLSKQFRQLTRITPKAYRIY